MSSTEHANGDSQMELKTHDCEDDGFALLDHSMIASQSPPLPSSIAVMRREPSFSDSSQNFSSVTGWDHFALHAHPNGDEQFSKNSSLNRPRPQSLSGPSSAHFNIYSQSHSPAWPPHGTLQDYAATTRMDNVVGFSNQPAISFPQMSIQAASSRLMDPIQVPVGNTCSPTNALPTSPQSCKEGWMSCSSSDGLDMRNLAQQTRAESPTFAASTHILRRDGIRKKNARFEIPAERNLRTIDQLINQTSDEHELKELKQQKRLLRNRQAALDSRQRKKQHTERLEEEKKHYTAVISELEDALNELKIQETEWIRTKESWSAAQQQYQQYVDSLIMEKDEMLQRHTLETGELRRKNTMLMDQLQRVEGAVAANAPTSAGFYAEFPDFDSLTMNGWDNYAIPSEFSIETSQQPSSTVVDPSKNDLVQDSKLHDDKSVASGFLLMLLLCGAWVASRNSTALAAIPSIPEDMRAASATVLDNLYKGSGIKLDGVGVSGAAATTHRFTDMTGIEVPSASSTITGLSHNPLDSIHHRLTAPSQQQLRDQVFTLSPSQFNELSSDHGHVQTHLVDGPYTRNVGQILGDLPLHGSSTADTYAKSLLMGKVSNQVLKDFARMVAESRNGPQMNCKSENYS